VAHQYRSRLLGTSLDALQQRPAPGVWSPLEYAAHVRDVLLFQRERAALALRSSHPTFESMRADERTVELRYNDEDPASVERGLQRSAETLAAMLDSLDDHEWQRAGTYPWPRPESRDLVWIGRHTVHELVHHLHDLTRSLQPMPGSASG
jgi:hypothetical protein